MECASLVSTHLSGSSLTWEPCLLGERVEQFDLFYPLETSQKIGVYKLGDHKF